MNDIIYVYSVFRTRSGDSYDEEGRRSCLGNYIMTYSVVLVAFTTSSSLVARGWAGIGEEGSSKRARLGACTVYR
jgi:hypothetical protein